MHHEMPWNINEGFVVLLMRSPQSQEETCQGAKKNHSQVINMRYSRGPVHRWEAFQHVSRDYHDEGQFLCVGESSDNLRIYEPPYRER